MYYYSISLNLEISSFVLHKAEADLMVRGNNCVGKQKSNYLKD